MHNRAFQKGARIPMTTDTYQRLALELRMAGEALITHPTPDTYNQLSKMFATLIRARMAGDAIDLANDALSDICDRFEEEGQIRITDVEAEHIRIAIMSLDARLPAVAVNHLRQAVAEVEVFCASVGA
jgi:hypothetical protein